MNNNEEIVRLLLSKNCNASIENKYHKYPGDIANEKDEQDANETIIQLLAKAEHHTLGFKAQTFRRHQSQQSEETEKNNKDNNNNNNNSNQNDNSKDNKNNENDNNGDSNKDEETPKAKVGGELGSSRHEKQSSIIKLPTMVQIHTISEESQDLPELEGWLEKKRGHSPKIYQKKWVVVAKPYILWSDKKTHIDDGNNNEARSKFDGCIHMLSIEKVEKIIKKKNKKLKDQNRFVIVGRHANAEHDNSRREFLFKCENEDKRDQWVRGLNKYLHYFHDMQEFFTPPGGK